MGRGKVAVIGGSGLTSLAGLEVVQERWIETPYGAPSARVRRGRLAGVELYFLPRHGDDHHLPPHLVNYRANMWALCSLDIEAVVAVAAVGGIDPAMTPGRLAVPDQIIDYTWGRAHTYADANSVSHVDFTEPFDRALRGQLLSAADSAGVDVVDGGTYGATQGPRLETAAEVRRLSRDGCHMVGMTAMPEAALARELDLAYASLTACVNWAAGLAPDGEAIHQGIERTLESTMRHARAVIQAWLESR